MNSYGLMRSFIRKYRWRYVYGIFWLLVVGSFQLIMPKILGALTDNFAAGELTSRTLLRYIALILGTAAATAVGRYSWRIYISGTARLIEYELRNSLYNHLQTLSTRFYTQNTTGDLLAHATNDINAVRNALGRGIVMLVDALFICILTVIIMFNTIDWRLTLMAMAPLPLLFALSLGFGRVIHRRFTRVQAAFARMTERVQENFAGMRVVKSFVQEKPEIERFMYSNQDYFDENMRLVRVWALFHPLVQLIAAVSFLIVLTMGGTMVIYGNISLGDFIAFNTYLGMLIWPMVGFGMVINVIQRGKASMDRLNTLFENKPEVRDESKSTQGPVPLQGEIEVRNLTFAYEKKQEPVLKNISFHVPAGSTLAIVGRTGSGKTTLMNLLLRLYNPPRGTILLDGREIRDIPLKQLRSSIGYVPQDTFLFSTSLLDNIGFGLEESEITEEKAMAAAKRAQVHGDILETSQGYQTVIGERGVTLSGGQKQRVAIARALIKNPTILILDDSLSAVDTNTEERILAELEEIMKTRTSIIISHRISTVKHADNILVLDDGQIIEQGSHQELLAKRGLYWDIYQKQLLQEELQGA
ncbi:MAG: ABC transporter ATP-binding protein [Firmicutes bacterium]|nr:ABC transporter ATP-binding protein [Bacillota bacterium]